MNGVVLLVFGLVLLVFVFALIAIWRTLKYREAERHAEIYKEQRDAQSNLNATLLTRNSELAAENNRLNMAMARSQEHATMPLQEAAPTVPKRPAPRKKAGEG